MKKHFSLLIAVMLILTLSTGCRSRGNDNKTPSTTTAPTTIPTTQAATEAADPTIASGNGPIDETSSVTESSTTTNAATDTSRETTTGIR